MPPLPKPRTFLGIDPGKQGGIVIVNAQTRRLDYTAVEKLTPQEMWAWIKSRDVTFAVMEKVGGYVGEGHARGAAMFNFGHITGMLEMCLIAAGIPYELVTPQKWMKFYSMSKNKGESDTVWKNRLKARAQALFPQEKLTLAVSDATLIANYCWQIQK